MGKIEYKFRAWRLWICSFLNPKDWALIFIKKGHLRTFGTVKSKTRKTGTGLGWKLTFDELTESLAKRSFCCFKSAKGIGRERLQNRGFDIIVSRKNHTRMWRIVGRIPIPKMLALYWELIGSIVRKSLANDWIRLKIVFYDAMQLKLKNVLVWCFYIRCPFVLDPTMFHVSDHFVLWTYGYPTVCVVLDELLFVQSDVHTEKNRRQTFEK